MQPYESDQPYPAEVEPKENDTVLSDQAAETESSPEKYRRLIRQQVEVSPKVRSVARVDEAEAEQQDPKSSKQIKAPEKENSEESSKDMKFTARSLSSAIREEVTVSNSQEDQSSEFPEKTSAVQGRKSLQRENHNAHTQRCREKINQMFQRLNAALPPRADGSHPRKKAEILIRALEIIKELQVENMSLRRTIQSLSRTQMGYSGQTGIVSFPVAEQLPLQRVGSEFSDLRTNMIPSTYNIHQQHHQVGNFGTLGAPSISLPFLRQNTVPYQENEDIRFAVPPASKTPKLPPINANIDFGRLGVSQIESGSPGSFPEFDKIHQLDRRNNQVPSKNQFFSDNPYVPGSMNMALLSSMAVPASQKLSVTSLQEYYEQDSAGVVPKTTDSAGSILFSRKDTEHKDI
jgi:hypothetical protein